MNKDLISRSALKEEFAKHEDRKGYLIGDWEDFIDNAPPVPLPEFKEGYKQAIIDGKNNFSRPQGEWKLHGMIYYCSKCGHECGESGDNFCGNCGADMRKEAEDGRV